MSIRSSVLGAHLVAAMPRRRTTTARMAVMLLLMASASAGAMWLKPTQRLAEQLPSLSLPAAVPTAVGPWRWAPELDTPTPPPQAGTLAARLYTQVLERTYVNREGYRLMVSVAYGPDQREDTQVHRPEFCYSAQGFAVAPAGVVSLATSAGPVHLTRLDTRANNRVEAVSYWTTVGTHQIVGGAQRRIEQLRYGLSGVIPDGVVFRVSSIDPDRERAFAAQESFVRQLSGQLEPGVRDRLVGRVN